MNNQQSSGGMALAAAAAAGLAMLGVVLLVVLAVAASSGSAQPGCGQAVGGDDPAPSGAAQEGIPANYLRLYRAAGRRYGLPWYVLAGIGKIESNHGRSTLQGVRTGANSAGAAGPMQIGIGGAAGNSWARVGVDGNHDGRKEVHDPEDAIPGAARYLKLQGGSLHDRIFSYNHAEWYVAEVMANARSYAGKSTAQLEAADNPAASSAGCSDGGGVSLANGKWTLGPGANTAGRPLTPLMTKFVDRVAGALPQVGGTHRLVLTTGTNHSKYSSSGLISDHWAGNAGDFGMVLNGGANDSPTGDHIAAACFMAAGLPRDQAISRAHAGGLQNVSRNGVRVQIIWKTAKGGNHHNHVHCGVKPTG